MRVPALVLLAAGLLCLTLSAAAKSYEADRYHVDLRLERGGILQVTESVTFRFAGGPFTYVYRDIAGTETDGIEVLQASLDGQPVHVQIEGARVRWNFDPVSDATHTFGLSYRARGVVRKDQGKDTLVWRALPGKREYRIARAEIRLAYPAGVTPLSPPRLRKGDWPLTDGSVVLSDVRPSYDAVVGAVFPAGALTAEMPLWQQRAAARSASFMEGARWGAALALGVAVAALLLWMRIGGTQRRAVAADNSGPLDAPPDGFAPALAAKLAGSHGRLQGLILDLAHRGAIRIEEGERRWGETRYRVVRQTYATALPRHEQVALDILCPGPSNSYADAVSKLASASQVDDAIRAELHSAGLLDDDRRRRRRTALATYGTLTTLAIAGLLLAAVLYRSDARLAGLLLALCGGSTLVGLLGLVMASSLTEWTDRGAAVAAQWKSFAVRLRRVAKGKEPAQFVHPESMLPYAAAFGCATAWAKRFHSGSGAPLPAWFASAGGDGSDGAFIALMGASDSAGAGGGDGGGASGGGGSGAG